MINDEKVQLPLTEEYENAFLGWITVDPEFFKSVINHIQSSWFINPLNAKVYELYQLWYKEHQDTPKPPKDGYKGEVFNGTDFNNQDPKLKKDLIIHFGKILSAQEHTTKNAIAKQLNAWNKSRIYNDLVAKSSSLYNQRKFSECYEEVRKNIRKIEMVNFGTSVLADFTLENLIKEQEQEHKGALTFGLNLMDGHLLEAARGDLDAGGLLKGDTTILLASVNIGKSSCLFNVAAQNIMRGKRVLITTHEGRELDIKLKLWCILAKCDRYQLKIKWQNNREEMLHIQQIIKNNLVYLPRNVANGTMEDTISAVRTHHNQMPLDLWVDDYPGTVSTVQATGGKLSRRERDDIVYGQVVDLAGELGFHALCAIQTNREGSRINRKSSADQENRLLTMEDVSESWGPMMRATNVISINRDPEAQSKDYLTYYICKSRSSKTGIAVVCKTRFAWHVTHNEYMPDIMDRDGQMGDFGGYSYEGTETHAEKTLQFLKMHRDRTITYEQLHDKNKI